MRSRPPTRQERRRRERDGRARERGWARWVGLGVVALAAVAVVAFLAAPRSTGDEEASPERRPAPAITLEDFDGRPVSLADFRGRPLVVNFWASWCLPCLAEMPGFEQVYQRHRDDVALLGINLADDVEPALQVVADTGITYPLARDPDGAAFTAFGALGMPTTVFIDGDGGIVELYTGALTAAALESRIVGYFES